MALAHAGYVEQAAKAWPKVYEELGGRAAGVRLRFAALSDTGQMVLFAKTSGAEQWVTSHSADIVGRMAHHCSSRAVRTVRAVVADDAHLVLLEMLHELLDRDVPHGSEL